MTRSLALLALFCSIVTLTGTSLFACDGPGGYGYSSHSYGYRPTARVVYSHPSYQPSYHSTYASSRTYYSQPQVVHSRPTVTTTHSTFTTQPSFSTQPSFQSRPTVTQPSGGFVSNSSGFNSRPSSGGTPNIGNPGRASGHEQLQFDPATGKLKAFNSNGQFLGFRRP